jgi:hypothetical protein
VATTTAVNVGTTDTVITQTGALTVPAGFTRALVTWTGTCNPGTWTGGGSGTLYTSGRIRLGASTFVAPDPTNDPTTGVPGPLICSENDGSRPFSLTRLFTSVPAGSQTFYGIARKNDPGTTNPSIQMTSLTVELLP